MKSVLSPVSALVLVSLPVRGAWVEIIYPPVSPETKNRSLPVRGAWVEIAHFIGI